MPPKAASAAGAGQQVDLGSLPTSALQQIHGQLNSELQHLQSSTSSLMAARSRFTSCISSLASLKPGQKPSLLVPLTTSLYVPGQLADSEKVLIDVGTGFYVEKKVEDAKKFYAHKVEELTGQVKQIEEIVRQKSGSLRVIEDVMRTRVMEGQKEGGEGAAAQAAA